MDLLEYDAFAVVYDVTRKGHKFFNMIIGAYGINYFVPAVMVSILSFFVFGGELADAIVYANMAAWITHGSIIAFFICIWIRALTIMKSADDNDKKVCEAYLEMDKLHRKEFKPMMHKLAKNGFPQDRHESYELKKIFEHYAVTNKSVDIGLENFIRAEQNIIKEMSEYDM